MLLTKRITSLLHETLAPPTSSTNGGESSMPSPKSASPLHTLLLLTPSGKLLSSSSPNPTSILRTQSTIACSLWALYQKAHSSSQGGYSRAAFADLISDALPRENDVREEQLIDDDDVSSLLIQLDQGFMVVRMLRCGLLFVAVAGTSPETMSSAATQALMQDQQAGTQSMSNSPPRESTDIPQTKVFGASSVQNIPSTDSTTDILSTDTAGEATSDTPAPPDTARSIQLVRRQAEAFGSWLDGQLSGWAGAPASAAANGS